VIKVAVKLDTRTLQSVRISPRERTG